MLEVMEAVSSFPLFSIGLSQSNQGRISRRSRFIEVLVLGPGGALLKEVESSSRLVHS